MTSDEPPEDPTGPDDAEDDARDAGDAGVTDPSDAIARDIAGMFNPLRDYLDGINETLRDAMRVPMPRFELPPDLFRVQVPTFELPDVQVMLGLTDLADRVFKPLEAYEAMLQPLRAQLAAIDFSALAPKLDPAIFEAFDRFFKTHMPPNWAGFEGWHDAATFISETGWPIVWLPRRDVVEALVAAPADDRDKVLIAHRTELLEDADRVLDDVTWAELAYLADCARETVATLRHGHDRPAQAFTGSILTGLLQGPMQYSRLSDARDAFDANWEEESVSVIRFVLITSTIPSALANFYPHRGDPVPARYNRHALAHVPDPTQLTETNALVGLMLVVALLRELQQLHDDGRLTS